MRFATLQPTWPRFPQIYHTLLSHSIRIQSITEAPQHNTGRRERHSSRGGVQEDGQTWAPSVRGLCCIFSAHGALARGNEVAKTSTSIVSFLCVNVCVCAKERDRETERECMCMHLSAGHARIRKDLRASLLYMCPHTMHVSSYISYYMCPHTIYVSSYYFVSSYKSYLICVLVLCVLIDKLLYVSSYYICVFVYKLLYIRVLTLYMRPHT
jgi:hypothetical protein